MRYYTVFNLSQTSGIEPKKLPQEEVTEEFEFTPVEMAERIINGMPKRPEIIYEQQRAFYRPSTDTVNLPRPETFQESAESYSTAFHELAHSTGHESCLNRPGITSDAHSGDSTYSKEELVAALAASYLCSMAGIETTTENSAHILPDGLKL